MMQDPTLSALIRALADATPALQERIACVDEITVVDLMAGSGVTQGAVSQHLKVLRDSGFASVRIDGARRIYAVNAAPMREVDAWLERFRSFWAPKLDALATEIARGKRQRRRS